MMWFEEFALGLSDYLFWPLILLTVILGAVVAQAAFARDDSKYGDPLYGEAKWRQFAAMQGGIIAWIIWIVLAAVPDPNYQVRIVNHDVIKQVSIGTKYQDVYKQCFDSLNPHLDTTEADKRCSERAMQLTVPASKVIVRTVYKADSYQDLYKTCIGDYSISDKVTLPDGKVVSGEVIRNQRIEMCHKQATETRASQLATAGG